MEYFYATEFEDGRWFPDETESRHIAKVLRKTQGSEITLVNGRGLRIRARLELQGKKLSAIELEREEIPRTHQLSIAVGPTKSADRMEWMIEKLVEIGVNRVIFIQTHNGERSKMQERRILMKAVAAMKQSLKVYLPEIEFGVAFSDLLKREADHRFLAHCYSDIGAKFAPEKVKHPGSKLLIAIGPEGDFTKDEVELAKAEGWQMLDLGSSRLRTETAALVACTLMQ